MNMKLAWVPAILGLAIAIGCDSKPADTVPTTAPMAAKQPHEILAHLKYVAVRKDFKDVPVIAPSDLTGLYGNAWWFHNHACTMGLALTAEEITGLGVTEFKDLGYIAPGVTAKDLQEAKDKVAAKVIPALPAEMANLNMDKLDKLPAEKDKNKDIAKDYAAVSGPMLRNVFQAGIYRLLKGIPTPMWNDIVVIAVKQNAGNTKDQDVFLGYKGETILQVTARLKADGTYGIIYIYYKAHPKTLAKMYAANNPAK
jgi:hypothetical protein